MTKQIHAEIISWATVHNLARKLALMIRRSGFQPDCIVAIARGGFIPARLLCDFLDITDLSSFRIVHYSAGADKHKEARLVDPLCRNLDGRSVLLVDDISDTGATLELARDHLVHHGAGPTRFAVLQHKKTSTMIPDYYAHEIIKWRWIIYPWAITEDISGFIERMPRRPADTGETLRLLEQYYGLLIRPSLMEKILQHPY